jgi:ABC-type antimicrobial peptide transport system permease subunit
MLFVHAEQLYETVFPSPPRETPDIAPESPLFATLVKEWKLLDRTESQTASQKKYRALHLNDWRGAILDVQTIHEVADEVLTFANAIQLVTVVGVVILFFIIQIGVVNTLRMTIRERTREIGTVRAIGMQRGDVRWSFVTEVVLLTLFACLTGIVLAWLIMQGLSPISIDTGGSEMGFFLMNNHLYFVSRIMDLMRNLVIIVGIAFLTAYFPARRAARLSVVEALRYYE